jgi:hypothetical protein
MRIGYTEERIAGHEYPRADEHESHFSKQKRLPIGGRLETDRLLLDRQEPRWVRLVTPRRGFLHHGIYVRHRTVVHYSWLAHGLRRGPVEEVPIARFARGPHIWVRARDPSDFDPPPSNKTCYRLRSDKCEHFCEWCLHGKPRSPQIEAWLAQPGCALRVALRLISEPALNAPNRFTRSLRSASHERHSDGCQPPPAASALT